MYLFHHLHNLNRHCFHLKKSLNFPNHKYF
nr:MAG TPA: hypothetical protein [Caudoviricetes sp.]